MNRYFKASLSLILAITVIFSCAISFGATSTTDTKEFEICDEVITLNNNEILFSAYNISENYTGQAELTDTVTEEETIVLGKDCIENPVTIETTPDAKYKFTTSGGGGHKFTFDNTGGMYRKMKVKLSHYNYFNEDGSHTTDIYTYHFSGSEYVGRNYYFSTLVIVSGGAINFVTPDKDGYVEFYVCTNIDTTTKFYTSFKYEYYTETTFIKGGGGGACGSRLGDFTKGVLTDNLSTVTIHSATELQRYLSKSIEFDKMKKYRADVDNNLTVNIIDVTKIQRYLALLE